MALTNSSGYSRFASSSRQYPSWNLAQTSRTPWRRSSYGSALATLYPRKQVADIRLPVEGPDPIHDPAHLLGRGPAPELGQAPGFVLELDAAQSIPRVPLRDVYPRGQAFAVGRLHLDEPDPPLRVGGVDLGVVDHLDPIGEPAELRIPERFVRELGDAGPAAQGYERQDEPHRELGLMYGPRVGYRSEHVDGGLVYMSADARYAVGGEVVLVHRLKQSVRRRMGVAARRVELERGLQDRTAPPEPVGKLRGIGIRGHPSSHALLTFEDTGGPGKPVAGDVRGEEPVGRCFAGVQLLRVGRIPEELPEPGGLRPCRTEGVEHDLVVGAEQVGDGGRRGERARRSGRVEDPVVRAAQVGADPDPGLVANYRG